LRSVEGQVLAEGEITQVAHGDKLKTSLVFHFKDTSLLSRGRSLFSASRFSCVQLPPDAKRSGI
jgi:hypothetical protein